MSSKDLAKVLIDILTEDKYSHQLDRYVVSRHDLKKFEETIELFLLRKFEEGRHVGRDHDEKS